MKVYFETLGCPKNFNDTEVAKAYVLNSGNSLVENPEDADAIVVVTCGFINDAKKESIDKIFEMSEYKDQGKQLIVSGCLSERYFNDLKDELPEVDYFLGVNDYAKLPDVLANRADRVNVSCKYDSILPRYDRYLGDNPYTATLKISEGCNNRCTYCAIPNIRGNFRSKKIEDIYFEAEELAKAGCKELILIAEDVTSYGIDLYNRFVLPELLEHLVNIEGIEWIRLMYCYEDRITDELIETIAKLPKICHYIDIPIQHVSDPVLKSMHRRSTHKSIENTLSRLRKAIPDIHIRTTFIVGFPGETEDDFNELYDFVNEARFARLGVFAYSQEENTPAGEMPNQIDEEIKQERVDAIMRSQIDISLGYNQTEVGNTLKVLVEGKDSDGSYFGRTEYDAPEIDNSILFTSDKELKAGDFVNVKVTDAFDYDLVGVEV